MLRVLLYGYTDVFKGVQNGSKSTALGSKVGECEFESNLVDGIE